MTIYKISNSFAVGGGMPAADLESRLADSLRAEGVDDIKEVDGGLEFQNYFSWALPGSFQIFEMYRKMMIFISYGLVKIDGRQGVVSYEISMFPLFALCALASILFCLFAGDLLWSILFLTYVWFMYDKIRSKRSVQFESFLKKVCSGSDQLQEK